MAMFGATGDVVAAFGPDGYGVLFNVRTDRYHSVNRTMARVWLELEQGHDLDRAIERVAAHYGTSPGAFREANAATLERLTEYGMLIDRWRTRGPAVRFGVVTPGPSTRALINHDAEPSSQRDRVLAACGFLIGLVLKRQPYARRLRLMQLAWQLRHQRPTEASTRKMLAAVANVAQRHPGWAACEEITLGAFLALVVLGRAPAWALEVSLGKVRFHSSLHDRVACDAVEPPPAPRYALIRIGAPPQSVTIDARWSSRG
jgi:hypothetical protein